MSRSIFPGLFLLVVWLKPSDRPTLSGYTDADPAFDVRIATVTSFYLRIPSCYPNINRVAIDLSHFDFL